MRVRPSDNPRMRRKFTPRRMAFFLEALAHCGCVTQAAAAARVARCVPYRRRRLDLEFAQRWAEARELGIAALEDEAVRRAVEGVEVPVFKDGRQVGTTRRYNDTLLIFVLNALKPEKYRQRVSAEIKGPGVPIASLSLNAVDPLEAASAYRRVMGGA